MDLFYDKSLKYPRLYAKLPQNNNVFDSKEIVLNWCNLVSISKKLMFYVFGVVRIYKKHHDEKLQTKIYAKYW